VNSVLGSVRLEASQDLFKTVVGIVSDLIVFVVVSAPVNQFHLFVQNPLPAFAEELVELASLVP